MLNGAVASLETVRKQALRRLGLSPFLGADDSVFHIHGDFYRWDI